MKLSKKFLFSIGLAASTAGFAQENIHPVQTKG